MLINQQKGISGLDVWITIEREKREIVSVAQRINPNICGIAVEAPLSNKRAPN